MSELAEKLLSLPQKELDKLPPEIRQQIELIRGQVFAARRLKTIQTAHDSLLDFTEMSMPDPLHPEDTSKSRYQRHKIHELMAKELEDVVKGVNLRLIISVQPRVGKSELVSRKLPAWAIGRDPYKQVITTSYGEDLAKDFGREVREVMKSPFYNQVFPNTLLRRNSQAADRLQTTAGGTLIFAGAGGTITGRGADILIVDDPIKDAEEARSRARKDSIWEWYLRVALSRVMGRGGAIIVTMTRWAEDDLVGRLTDPELGYTTEEDAAQWRVINIPAFAEENDPLGREIGEVLWEDRTPKAFLESFRRMDPAGFAALFMGKPAPPEGNFFKREGIRSYQMKDLPTNLRYYAASDHAVSQLQGRDSTCMGVVGVDEEDNIYVLPDLIWAQLDAEDQVSSMMELMTTYRPLVWWAEKGHISQSIGPFLRKRMQEEKVYVTISERTPVKDKQTRAQPIQGRMSMGKVFLPMYAPWYANAVEQLLNFPNGAHDDFCVVGDTQVSMGDGSRKEIRDVGVGEYVQTPTGSRRVEASAKTADSAEVYLVKFSDGTEIEATGKHPIATTLGFVNVDRLTEASVVLCENTSQEAPAWLREERLQQRSSNTGDIGTEDTQIANTRSIENIFTQRNLEGVSFIGTCGRTTMDIYRKVTTSIIGTMTLWTIGSTICRAFLWGNTEHTTCGSGLLRPSIKHTWMKYDQRRLLGTDLKKEGLGTLKWLRKLGTSVSEARLRAWSATLPLRLLSLIGPNFARQPVVIGAGINVSTNDLSPKRHDGTATDAEQSIPTRRDHKNTVGLHVGTKIVMSVDRLRKRKPVYNLTVEGAHVYYANGTLTHNCDYIAWIGIGLNNMIPAQRATAYKKEEPRSGSLEWILKSSDRIRKQHDTTEKTLRYFH